MGVNWCSFITPMFNIEHSFIIRDQKIVMDFNAFCDRSPIHDRSTNWPPRLKNEEFCCDLKSQFESSSLAESSGQFPFFNSGQVKFHLFFLIALIHSILKKSKYILFYFNLFLKIFCFYQKKFFLIILNLGVSIAIIVLAKSKYYREIAPPLTLFHRISLLFGIFMNTDLFIWRIQLQ